MVARSGAMCVIALIVIAAAGFGLSRVPTGFLPIEDQGYVLVAVQLPGRRFAPAHQACRRRGQRDRRQDPGVDQVIAISGVSALDNNSSLANAGVA